MIKIRDNNSTRIENVNGIDIIRLTALDDIPFVDGAFSTRSGGVSTGIYESMNLSFTRGDEPENVLENFKRFTSAIGVSLEDCVMTYQTHTTCVTEACEEYKGMGIIKEYSYTDIDGMITDKPGLCIVTSYADCVPIFLVDKKNKAIAASHSGWKGTVGNITKNTLKLMNERYGTNPVDVYAIVGPSICKECYEVSEDVADRFREVYSSDELVTILTSKGNGKYLLDLHEANRYNLLNEGVLDNNISVTDICTSCNADKIFSHRKSQGKRGGMCGFLWIKRDN